VRLMSSHQLAVGAAVLALITACRAEAPTGPIGTPAGPQFTLTGVIETEIFPTVAPGNFQPTGVAIGLNAAGQVTGTGHLSASQNDFKAFRWSSATGALLITGCCETQWGNDINDAGVVVGTGNTSATVGNRGFVASGSTTTPLSILPGADPGSNAGAVAINNAGQTVGSSNTASGTRHAVVWSSAGVIQDLGTLGGSNSEAIDINASGQVIGSSLIAGDATTHFFLWSSGSGMTDLNTTINAAITSVVEINDAGQIIGTHTTPGGESHAFLYTLGSGVRDLGTLGGTTSAPTGLNDAGQVVGSSTLADGSTHAFLWTPTDGMDDITIVSGIRSVRRLNDRLQTLGGPVAAPTSSPEFSTTGDPLLVQLNFTPSSRSH